MAEGERTGKILGALDWECALDGDWSAGLVIKTDVTPIQMLALALSKQHLALHLHSMSSSAERSEVAGSITRSAHLRETSRQGTIYPTRGHCLPSKASGRGQSKVGAARLGR